MRSKGITKYALMKYYSVSPGQLTRLKRNEYVSTHTIEMLCQILDCRVEDIMEYQANAKENADEVISVSRKAESTGEKEQQKDNFPGQDFHHYE